MCLDVYLHFFRVRERCAWVRGGPWKEVRARCASPPWSLPSAPCWASGPCPSPAAASTAPATLTVVHGVLGLTVDAYVNGTPTLEDFTPRSIAGPLSLPAGSYAIAVVPANGDPASPAIAATAGLAAGSNVSLVAHLAADGTPTLTPFVNDVRRAGWLKGRVAVRHAAAAPAVDVPVGLRLGSFVLPLFTLRDLSHAAQQALATWPLPLSVRLTPAGQPHVTVLGPASLTPAAGKLTAVYAIGSLGDGTLELLVQQLPLEGWTRARRARHAAPRLSSR